MFDQLKQCTPDVFVAFTDVNLLFSFYHRVHLALLALVSIEHKACEWITAIACHSLLYCLIRFSYLCILAITTALLSPFLSNKIKLSLYISNYNSHIVPSSPSQLLKLPLDILKNTFLFLLTQPKFKSFSYLYDDHFIDAQRGYCAWLAKGSQRG